MLKIFVKRQSSYSVNSVRIKKFLKKFFMEHGIVSDSDVTVTVVGEKKMVDLAKKYLNEDSVHNVLSFPASESNGEFMYPPDEKIHLGDIIICYPKVLEEAGKEGKLIDDKVEELIEHGALHLMGIHHKE